MVRWQLVLATAAGVDLGELGDVSGRGMRWRLNSIPSLDFTMRLTHPRAEQVLEEDCLLVKLYRSRREDEPPGDPWMLFEIYDVASSEESGTGDSAKDGIAVVCEGTFARLGTGPDSPGRLIGKSTAGYTRTNEDRGLTMKHIIDTVNAEDDTGLRVGTIVPSSSDTYGPVYFKPAGEAIAIDLSGPLDGPDFQVVALEPTENAGKVGEFQASPVLGTLRDELFFEYGAGTRANVSSYKRMKDRRGRLHRAYALPPSFPDPESLGVVASWQQLQAGQPLREAVVASDIADLELRQFLCAEHVRLRHKPRKGLLFTPHVNGPEFGVDFDIGDIVRGRVRNAGTTREDGWFRIMSFQLQPNEEGKVIPQVGLDPTEA